MMHKLFTECIRIACQLASDAFQQLMYCTCSTYMYSMVCGRSTHVQAARRPSSWHAIAWPVHVSSAAAIASEWISWVLKMGLGRATNK